MTKQDLIKKIQIKMDIDPTTTAIENDYYKNYYDSLIDEGLSVIANTVIPNQKIMKFRWLGYIDNPEGFTKNPEEGDYYTVGADFWLNDDEFCRRKDWLKWDGETWQKQARNHYGFLATIPDGFLSFSDEAPIKYYNQYDELELNVDVLYVDSKTVALSKDGTYEIQYNAEYDSIEDVKDEIKNIPRQVLDIIPSYVAGQLLMGEDPIKATQLKNEFETMMARLDINKPLVSYSINNSDGWVL